MFGNNRKNIKIFLLLPKDGSINLLINSKEQIFTEKLKSLLKFGIHSLRYKDLFDFCYLIGNTEININKSLKIIDILIFNDENMYENNIYDIRSRLEQAFKSQIFRKNLNNPKYNWLDVPIDTVISNVLDFIHDLEKEEIAV